jgi:hypothetical protein
MEFEVKVKIDAVDDNGAPKDWWVTDMTFLEESNDWWVTVKTGRGDPVFEISLSELQGLMEALKALRVFNVEMGKIGKGA